MGATFLAAIDAPTATIIAAVAAGVFGLVIRWAPKTRSEAGVERANARKADAESWALLQQAWAERNRELVDEIRALRERITVAEARAHAAEKIADEARSALENERRECDQQIRQLLERIVVLEAARDTTGDRVWFRE